MRTAYGDRGGCLAARRPRALARSIEFKQLAQTGAAGTASVIPTGGPYDGIEVRVDFESADGFGPPWRVSALEADVPAGP